MFNQLLEQFKSNILGLREYVDLIQPMLDEYHKKEKEKYNEALVPLVLAHQIKVEEDPEKKDKLQKKLSEIFEGEIEVNIKDIDNDDSDEVDVNGDTEEGKSLSFSVKGDTTEIDKAFEFQVKSSSQRNLLYVNSVISLLSSAEWFYSRLLHFFYDKHPNAAGIKNKSLTLEELKTFGTVEDAEKYLIDSKIENLLRSSFSDWVETLKNELKLGLGYLDDFIDELVEIYQRRNLLVHNGGIVNSIYLANTSGKYHKGVEIGEKLTVDEAYLNNAINKIHVCFSLIACELWKKIEADNEERADILIDLSYYYLQRKEWQVAFIPNYFLSNDNKMPTEPKTIAQLNCWLCKKRSDDPQKLMKEIESVDFSDKAPVLRLALNALKEDKESLFKELPRIIDTGELPVKYLLEFPIFEDMRKLNEYQEFISSNKKVEEYINEINELDESEDQSEDATNKANQADG